MSAQRWLWLTGGICALSLLACLQSSGYHCASTAQCTLGGVCEANGYCSFVDASCASGRRFGAFASSEAAGKCTDLLPDAGLDSAADVDLPEGPVVSDGSVDAAIDAPPDAPACATRSPFFVVDMSFGTGSSCNVQNAVTADGFSAGLDYGDSLAGPLTGTVDGQPVTGCIRADFGTTPPGTLLVRAGSVSQACTTPCCCGFCNTPVFFCVYYSATTTASDFHLFGCNVPSATLSDFVYTVPSATARYVLICRSGHGPSAPDVVIDSVAACR